MITADADTPEVARGRRGLSRQRCAGPLVLPFEEQQWSAARQRGGRPVPMLNFGQMTPEVLGEAALPMPVAEDPLVLRRQVRSRRARSSLAAPEHPPGGGSGTVTGGGARYKGLVAESRRVPGVAEELEAEGSHRSRKDSPPSATPDRCRQLGGSVASRPAILLHRRLHELSLDRESGCWE